MADALRHPVGGYGLAIAAVLATTGVMAALPFLHPFTSPPFLFVVLFFAWAAGYGPAVTAAAVSVVSLTVLLPAASRMHQATDLGGSVLFLLVALVMAWLAASLRRTRDERLVLHEREAAARAEAQEANRAKDEFLAILGHEFRTPLAAIRASLHVLDRVTDDDERGAIARGVIRHQVDQLARMVDDLLDVNRLVSQRVTLDRAPLDLAEAVGASLATVVSTGATRKRSITVETEPVWVEADALRLQRAIINVLDNAVKYTPPEGTIRVCVRRDGPDAVVEVQDDGVGIPPEILPRIFDLFVRADHRAQRGLGIGLAVVRRLVELHGGRIEAASDGPGRGSRFTISLPRVPRPAGAGRGNPLSARPAC